MKRYVLAPVIEEFTADGRVLRADVPDSVNTVVAIAVDSDGNLLHPWALVKVAANDLGVIMRDQRLGVLPDFPLDAVISAMSNQGRRSVRDACAKFGLPDMAQGRAAFRDTVRDLGLLLDANFHEDRFDVSE